MSLLSSWVTVAWALVGFHRALRRSHYPVRAPMTKAGMAAQFTWRLFTLAARVLAFVVFGSAFKGFLFVVVGLHFFLMLAWVSMQHTDYCTLHSNSTGKEHHSPFLEALFRIMAAFVHIFCFFNLLDGHTRLRALLFYALVYAENSIMVLAWYISGSTTIDTAWYRLPVFITVFVGFLMGILSMLVYYVRCHPNQYSDNPRHQKIKLWVKCDDLSLFRDPNAVEHTRSETDNSSLMTQGLQNMPLGPSTPPGYPCVEYGSSAGSFHNNWGLVLSAKAPNNEMRRNNNRVESPECTAPQSIAHGIPAVAAAPQVAAHDPQSEPLLERHVSSADQRQPVSTRPASQRQVWPADQNRPGTHGQHKVAVQERPANHRQNQAAVQERLASQKQERTTVQDRPANQRQNWAAVPESPPNNRSPSASVTVQEPSGRKSSKQSYPTADEQNTSVSQKARKSSRRSASQVPEPQPVEQGQAGRSTGQRNKRSGRSPNRRRGPEAAVSSRQTGTVADTRKPASRNPDRRSGHSQPATQRQEAPIDGSRPRKKRRKRTTGQTKPPNQKWDTPNILLANQFQPVKSEVPPTGTGELALPVSEIKRDGLRLGHHQRRSFQPENNQGGDVDIPATQPPEAYKVTCV